MHRSWNTFTPLLGRILLSAIFIMSGFGKIADFSGTMGYMEARGMIYIPVFLVLAIIFEIVGGAALLLGWKTRLAALALIVFLVPATLIFHSFWTYPEAEQRAQMINFMKNLAIMGGLFMAIANGPGRLSVDGRKKPEAVAGH